MYTGKIKKVQSSFFFSFLAKTKTKRRTKETKKVAVFLFDVSLFLSRYPLNLICDGRKDAER